MAKHQIVYLMDSRAEGREERTEEAPVGWRMRELRVSRTAYMRCFSSLCRRNYCSYLFFYSLRYLLLAS